jgi:phosphomannomutase
MPASWKILMTKALIFDMDGTLTPSRHPVPKKVLKALRKIRGKYKLYLVTGSNFSKVEEQFGWDKVIEIFEKVMCCNGTTVFQTSLDPDDEHGNLEPDLIHKVSLIDHYSQADLNHVISVLLKYAAKNHTKYKTGTFVEWRDSQINFSLIGRNCSQAQREDYAKWDKKSGDRDRAIKFLEKEFKSYGLAFRKGGQISIDISRNEWSKAYAFENIDEKPEDCVFFGDNIVPIGNDWEIAKMCGKFHAVDGPDEFLEVLAEY